VTIFAPVACGPNATDDPVFPFVACPEGPVCPVVAFSAKFSGAVGESKIVFWRVPDGFALVVFGQAVRTRFGVIVHDVDVTLLAIRNGASDTAARRAENASLQAIDQTVLGIEVQRRKRSILGFSRSKSKHSYDCGKDHCKI